MSKKYKNQSAKPLSKEALNLPKWLQPSVQQWIVFAFGLVLYANTLGHDFTQDDAIVIQENMFTQQGIKGVPGILEYDTFYGFFKDPTKLKLVSGGRYRPFTLVIFAGIHQLFDNSPAFYHFFSILLYAFTCMLLYNVLLMLLKTRFSDLQAGFIAFCSALLFAGHPIHTEVVANVKGLDETFSLLGSLAALWFCIKAKESAKLKFAWIGAVCFFIGLMSKENAITYLAIIPLSLWYFYREKLNGIIRYGMPYFVAVVAFLFLRTAVIGFDFGGAPQELMNNPYLKVVGNEYVAFSPAEKLATIIYTLGLYIKLLLIPHPLTHDYYPRHIGIMSFSDIAVLFSFLVYVILAIIAFKGLKKRTLVSFSIFYFLITLSIVSNLFFPIGTNMSERFMFMPSIGLCLILAYGLNLLVNKASTQMSPVVYQKGIMIAAVFLLAYSFKSYSRNGVWKDNYTLFTTDVKTSVNSAKLQNSVGGELIAKAVKEKDDKIKNMILEEAISHLQKALEIHPTYHNAYLLLGNAHFVEQKYEEAIKDYENCLRVYPQNKDAEKNILMAYREGGKFYGEKQGNITKAFEFLNKAYSLDPNDYETNRLLGVANGVSGNTQKALEYFKKAAEINPSSDAFKNLSMAYFNTGDKINGDLYARKAAEKPAAPSGNSEKK